MTSALDTRVGYTVSEKQVKSGNREVNLTFFLLCKYWAIKDLFLKCRFCMHTLKLYV